jgi:hypothetical protein
VVEDPKKTSHSDEYRLDSWKEIAVFLKCNIRTCQRWEKKLQLPVYRIDNKSDRSKVFAYKTELDRWLKSRTETNPPQLQRYRHSRMFWYISIGLIVFLIIFYGKFWIKPKKTSKILLDKYEANPVQFVLKGSHVVFLNEFGGFLWEKNINNPGNLFQFYAGQEDEPSEDRTKPRTNAIAFCDIDEDGRNEIAAFIYNQDPQERYLALFDDDGKTLWQKTFEFNQEYEEGKVLNDYYVRELDFQDINGDGDKEIVALWNHFKRFPSALCFYGTNGHELLSYVHTGQLTFFKTYGEADKKRIYLGGTNNLLDNDGVLVVLNGQRCQSGIGPPYSIASDLEGIHEDLKGYIPIRPKRAAQELYIRFRRNEVTRAMDTIWLNVRNIWADKNEIMVAVNYAKSCPVYFHFDPDFNLRYVKESSNFARAFEAARREGKVRIPLVDFLRTCGDGISFWDGKDWVHNPPKIDPASR